MVCPPFVYVEGIGILAEFADMQKVQRVLLKYGYIRQILIGIRENLTQRKGPINTGVWYWRRQVYRGIVVPDI